MAENRKTITLLKGFNNYFNRTIIYYDDVRDYENNIDYLDCTNINFKPNDDVSTEIVLNLFDNIEMKDSDYLLVRDGETIESRWFIQHAHRTRQGQYQFTLRRDVIVDNLNKIMQSPIFVERGFITNQADPFILNDEGMNLNQIKKDEVLLKDITNVGWIVGYVPNDKLEPFYKNEGQSEVPLYAETPSTLNYTADNTISFANLADMLNITTTQLQAILNIGEDSGTLVDKINGDITIKAWVNWLDNTDWEIRSVNKINQSFSDNSYSETNPHRYYSSDISSHCIGSWEYFSPLGVLDPDNIQFFWNFGNKLKEAIATYKNQLKNNWFNIIGRVTLTQSQYNQLQSLSSTGKYISYNNRTYRLKILPNGTINRESYHYSTENTTIKNITDYVNNSLDTYSHYDSASNPTIKTEYNATQLSLVLEPAGLGIYRTHLNDSRNRASDSAYSMFAIPYGGVKYSYRNQTTYYDTQSKSYSGVSGQQGVQYEILFPKQTGYSIADPQTDITYAMTDNGSPSSNFDVNMTEDSNYWRFTGTMFGMNVKMTITIRFTVQSSGNIPILEYTDMNYDDSIAMALSIAKLLGKDWIYDLQLLPYCPCLDFVDNATNAILLQNLTENVDYDYIQFNTGDNWVNKGIVLYPKSCNIRMSIDYPLNLITSMKVDSNCDNYRLVSPNGSGGFDFNVAKNGGSVDFFIVDCTYKPYNPYIRIAPQFKGLYGSNFHDTRGLVCGGDFSLPLISDPWRDYQLQNKNYANIFDREIQNLEFKQSRERTMQEVAMPFKILSAGVIGGTTGGQATGSPYGAIAGALIGTTAGAVGSSVDLALANEMRAENKRYAIDKWNYHLGNIKALPTSLARNTSYTINNKIFPYLEYYTCTEEEREAFESKIEWDSMTVMRIGYMVDYIEQNKPHYFKGRLIRGIEIEADNHVLQEINDELEKGVYI